MKIIATLPPPHQLEKLRVVAENPLITEARFNVGMRTPYSPKETLERLLDVMRGKPLWIDLKGRQLRIKQWAKPGYGDIYLSHAISVDLPATIRFRGSEQTQITAVKGNRIFVDPNPPSAIGCGQSVNIHGNNLVVAGYLTREDRAYIKAAKELGLHQYMLSFVESEDDFEELFADDADAKIIAKIESPKGLEFIEREVFYEYLNRGLVSLMAARDDLYINIGEDKLQFFEALDRIISIDPTAIVASRLLDSLVKDNEPSLGDLSDVILMRVIGYQSLMLSDELCSHSEAFGDAMSYLERFDNLSCNFPEC